MHKLSAWFPHRTVPTNDTQKKPMRAVWIVSAVAVVTGFHLFVLRQVLVVVSAGQ